jgi:hypothetical protein
MSMAADILDWNASRFDMIVYNCSIENMTLDMTPFGMPLDFSKSVNKKIHQTIDFN